MHGYHTRYHCRLSSSQEENEGRKGGITDLHTTETKDKCGNIVIIDQQTSGNQNNEHIGQSEVDTVGVSTDEGCSQLGVWEDIRASYHGSELDSHEITSDGEQEFGEGTSDVEQEEFGEGSSDREQEFGEGTSDGELEEFYGEGSSDRELGEGTSDAEQEEFGEDTDEEQEIQGDSHREFGTENTLGGSVENIHSGKNSQNMFDRFEIGEELFESLYDGAKLSTCGAIMHFKSSCRLSFVTIERLLKIAAVILSE